MYAGAVYNFFYKPKSWIMKQPKFVQKQDNTYININGRIYKINESKGEMALCYTIPKKINFPKTEKPKKIKNKLNLYSIKRDKDIENFKNNFLNSDNIKSMSERNYKFFQKYPELNDNKNEKNKNNITLDNSSSFRNECLGKSHSNNKLNSILTSKNNNNSSNNRAIEPFLYSNIYNLSTNLNSLKDSNLENSIKNDKLYGNKTLLYFNKNKKKYFKPKIAFGQKILKSFSLNNTKKSNIINKADKNDNLLFLMDRQHNNNIKGEGRINEKIYEKTNNDNIIFKTFKDQIFKDKIVNGLKKKYQFYEDKNDTELKVPLITYQNFNFYRGYSFSDKNRKPIHQKLFFQYINKHKLKEKEDLENE